MIHRVSHTTPSARTRSALRRIALGCGACLFLLACDVVSPIYASESSRHGGGTVASMASAGVGDIVAEATSCFRTCDDDEISNENRPTCVLRCVSDLEPSATDCETACLDTYATCWNPCGQKQPPTDVFTCRLQCEQNAAQCVQACDDVDADSGASTFRDRSVASSASRN